MAFETTPARVAIRDKLIAALCSVPIEGTITHEQIAKIIGARTTSPDAIKHSAMKVAAEESGAAFENIRGVGYRRLSPNDINRVGRHTRHSIRGKAKRGSRKILAVIQLNSNSMGNAEKIKAHAEIAILGMIGVAAGRSAADRAYKAAGVIDERTHRPPSQREIAESMLSVFRAHGDKK